MKFATVMGACLSYSLQVRRPIVVSMTAVGAGGSDVGLDLGGGAGSVGELVALAAGGRCGGLLGVRGDGEGKSESEGNETSLL